MDSASRSFGENSRLQNVRVDPSDAQTKYLGPEPLQRHTKACTWVPVDGEVYSTTKVGQEGLFC